MEVSFTSASSIVKGLKGWVARRRATAPADIETPETGVVWACGHRGPMDDNKFDARREFAAQRDRWPLGPGHDNFA